jgi:hypothetical protein
MRYEEKCVLVFTLSASYSSQIIKKLKFFPDRFYQNTEISNFVKTRPVRAKLFHADGRTDMTNLLLSFCNFAKTLKKESSAIISGVPDESQTENLSRIKVYSLTDSKTFPPNRT